MRFTKPNIAKLSLPRGKADQIVFDEALPSFGIRLRGGGKRTWIVQYRVGTRQRRLTLGSADAMNLDQARAAARNALAKVGLLVDPQAEKEKARSALTSPLAACLIAIWQPSGAMSGIKPTARPSAISGAIGLGSTSGPSSA